MVKIVLDAGHYYGIAGRRCLKRFDPNETREWTLNSRVAEYVEEFLKEGYVGFEIMRTDDRTGKNEVSLKDRTDKANKWGADVLISIHHDWGINGGKGGGITVFRHPQAHLMTHTKATSLYTNLIAETGLRGNRATPVNTYNFHMLRETKAMAVLIEGGFMDSEVDVPIIITDKHARGYARAIVKWLVSEFKLKSKPTPPPIPPIKKGFFRVVVGSYRDRANAVNMQDKLKKAGFDSFLLYVEE